MTKVHKAITWGLAFIFIAVGSACGMIEQDTATTMMAIMPALAVISINGDGNCAFRSDARA